MKQYFTMQDVRTALLEKLQWYSQTEISKATGVHAPNVSLAVRGGHIPAKLLDWLGYEKANDVYRRKP